MLLCLCPCQGDKAMDGQEYSQQFEMEKKKAKKTPSLSKTHQDQGSVQVCCSRTGAYLYEVKGLGTTCMG